MIEIVQDHDVFALDEARDHSQVDLEPGQPRIDPASQIWPVKEWATLVARHLSPGWWRLRVWAAGCDEVSRTIEVGDETQTVRVELQRSTIR